LLLGSLLGFLLVFPRIAPRNSPGMSKVTSIYIGLNLQNKTVKD
jgi:hypothetical protein